MLAQIETGDLFMIYGASSAETDKSHRNRVLGFLQVEARAIRDVDRSSAAGKQRKRDCGWLDKWTYAIPVVCAWRGGRVHSSESYRPGTYRREAGRAIAVWSPPLLPEEVELALKIRVTEVSVFASSTLWLPYDENRSRSGLPAFPRLSRQFRAENVYLRRRTDADVSGAVRRRWLCASGQAQAVVRQVRAAQDRCLQRSGSAGR